MTRVFHGDGGGGGDGDEFSAQGAADVYDSSAGVLVALSCLASSVADFTTEISTADLTVNKQHKSKQYRCQQQPRKTLIVCCIQSVDP